MSGLVMAKFDKRKSSRMGRRRDLKKGRDAAIDPLKVLILRTISDHDRLLTTETLGASQSLKDNTKQAVERSVKELLKQKFLKLTADRFLCFGDSLRMYRGEIILNSSGFGFFKHGDGDDWYIPPEYVAGYLSGDQVDAIHIAQPDKERSDVAVPMQLVVPVSRKVVAIIENYRDKTFPRSLAGAIPGRFEWSKKVPIQLEHMDVCVVELLAYDNADRSWNVRFVKRLGSITDPGIENSISIVKHNISDEFSTEVLQEVDRMPDQVLSSELANRIDLRDKPFVTIDGPSARDFDDAVFVFKEGDNFVLQVAIADVSHYVSEGSAIDQAAKERGTSTYFPAKAVPMLPDPLSSGICSLLPHSDRLVVVARMHFDGEGHVIDSKFSLGVINSHRRLTYEEVDGYLLSPQNELPKLAPRVHDNLKVLKEFTEVMLKQRQARGALDLETVEPIYEFDSQGAVVGVSDSSRYFAHKMIEESMLVANVCAANFLEKQGVQFLRRVHPPPDLKKVTQLSDRLSIFGIKALPDDVASARDYSEVLTEAFDHSSRKSISSLILRSMSQAFYSEKKGGHFGLNYDCYTHFTSPIRRYPDLDVHRKIKSVISKTKLIDLNLDELAVLCSHQERNSDKASRFVQGWLSALVAQAHIREEFDGTVTSVVSFGCFVNVDAINVEGLVHVTDLGGDYFYYDSVMGILVGERSGLQLYPGVRLRVEITKADIESGQINLRLSKQGKRVGGRWT